MLSISVNVPKVDQSRTRINVSTKPLNVLPKIESMVGNGGQGVVYKGHWKSILVAVKFIPLNENSIRHFEKEIEALSILEHPNICNLVGWYIRHIPQSIPTAALVTEFYSGGELFSKVMKEKLSNDVIMNIFLQLFEAVFYMHSNNMIHCDIKLENIVLTSKGTPILIDFGLRDTCNVGTLYYASPEVRYMVHKGIDIWALGICLFACLTQTFPWTEAHERCNRYKEVIALMETTYTSMCDAVYAHRKSKCPFPFDIKYLLDSMLCVDYKYRCTIMDIQQSIISNKDQCYYIKTNCDQVMKKRKRNID